MFKLKFGDVVVSNAGHDKGEVFIILKQTSEYVYLMDGKHRTFEKPKKKNIKHISPLAPVGKALQEKIDANKPIINEDIKRAIKLLKQKL